MSGCSDRRWGATPLLHWRRIGLRRLLAISARTAARPRAGSESLINWSLSAWRLPTHSVWTLARALRLGETALSCLRAGKASACAALSGAESLRPPLGEALLKQSVHHSVPPDRTLEHRSLGDSAAMDLAAAPMCAAARSDAIRPTPTRLQLRPGWARLAATLLKSPRKRPTLRAGGVGRGFGRRRRQWRHGLWLRLPFLHFGRRRGLSGPALAPLRLLIGRDGIGRRRRGLINDRSRRDCRQRQRKRSSKNLDCQSWAKHVMISNDGRKMRPTDHVVAGDRSNIPVA